MREVTVTKSVQAPAAVVERALTAEQFIDNEGSFRVVSSTDEDTGSRLTVAGGGLRFELRTESRADGGIYYEQAGDAGPFEHMETTVTFSQADDETTLTATSKVSLGLPPAAITDRIAAWKRRGELRRALDNFADSL